VPAFIQIHDSPRGWHDVVAMKYYLDLLLLLLDDLGRFIFVFLGLAPLLARGLLGHFVVSRVSVATLSSAGSCRDEDGHQKGIRKGFDVIEHHLGFDVIDAKMMFKISPVCTTVEEGHLNHNKYNATSKFETYVSAQRTNRHIPVRPRTALAISAPATCKMIHQERPSPWSRPWRAYSIVSTDRRHCPTQRLTLLLTRLRLLLTRLRRGSEPACGLPLRLLSTTGASLGEQARL